MKSQFFKKESLLMNTKNNMMPKQLQRMMIITTIAMAHQK